MTEEEEKKGPEEGMPDVLLTKLLVVDDEVAFAELVDEVATPLGFAVSMAHDGPHFRHAFMAINPDVIFLDLRLPDEDGIELMRYLSAKQCTAKVIIVSGADGRTISAATGLARQRKIDVVGTLAKPVDIVDLEAMLRPLSRAALIITPETIANGIRAGEFVVHFQPKVRLDGDNGKTLEGVEALVRWNHPVRGLIFPDAFIPIAQGTPAIADITHFVTREAIKAVRGWLDQGHEVSVGINIDGSLLEDLDLPDRIEKWAAESGVPTRLITLEMTESAAMADPAATMDILTRMRLKDFNVSMDDFGTGFSSLVQLYRLPFNELKIDKSFVMDLKRNQEARDIVETLTLLGKRLGIASCAEGIEDQAAAEFVRNCGCEVGQGYLFSKAVEPEKITELLGKWGSRAKT